MKFVFFLFMPLVLASVVIFILIQPSKKTIPSVQNKVYSNLDSYVPLSSIPAGVNFVGAGDIADCESEGDEATVKLLDTIAGTVFTLGDNVYPVADYKTLMDCYDTSWGRHKARTRPSQGNHDIIGRDTLRDASSYHRYFGANAGDPKDGFYSYNLGSWHIIALNSNKCGGKGCDKGTYQHNWLIKDLEANKTKCTLAYWHVPRFSSGNRHGSNKMMADIWEALYEAGIDIILAGHEHNYERFAPLNPLGEIDKEKGIRSFIIGTGGKSLYGFGEPITGSEVRNADTFGVLKLTLFPKSYHWEFVPVEGGTFHDSGYDFCH